MMPHLYSSQLAMMLLSKAHKVLKSMKKQTLLRPSTAELTKEKSSLVLGSLCTHV